MPADSGRKFRQAAQEYARRKGEEIAREHAFETYPVDPFAIVEAEHDQLHAEGDDFGDSFDGRLSFPGRRFLLVYNTRYNAWPKRGTHHPKVRFTVAHELGHFYLDDHRKYLVTRRKPIESMTEFESDKQVEQEADAFATGLLMPEYLLSPVINLNLDATVEGIKHAAVDFDVSLTGMMVRWTQLSHFPCATLCIRHGHIEWGFVSEAFRRSGLWKARRGGSVKSTNAKKFFARDPSCARFREGRAEGLAQHWLEGECIPIPLEESYAAIPYSHCVMVFLAADEGDLPTAWDHDE